MHWNLTLCKTFQKKGIDKKASVLSKFLPQPANICHIPDILQLHLDFACLQLFCYYLMPFTNNKLLDKEETKEECICGRLMLAPLSDNTYHHAPLCWRTQFPGKVADNLWQYLLFCYQLWPTIFHIEIPPVNLHKIASNFAFLLLPLKKVFHISRCKSLIIFALTLYCAE